MSILFTFPGQGAVQAGILHALPVHAEVKRTLAEAGQALGADPLRLDTPAALASTVAVQLCLLIAGVAMARVLAAHGARPDMVAGLSIGAYPAAVCAGALDFSAAVKLVAQRARLMEQAYPRGYGMAAINGLDRYQLAALLASIHAEDNPVYLANLNAPRQLVIAGADAALDAVLALARAQGATRAERLAVRVPSHCPLYDDAAQALAAAFASVTLRRPGPLYLSGNAARALSEPLRIADDLAHNMARQVHWHDTIALARERGASLALEMPGGAVLSKLDAPLFEPGQAFSCDNTRLDTVLALLAREKG